MSWTTPASPLSSLMRSLAGTANRKLGVKPRKTTKKLQTRPAIPVFHEYQWTVSIRTYTYMILHVYVYTNSENTVSSSLAIPKKMPKSMSSSGFDVSYNFQVSFRYFRQAQQRCSHDLLKLLLPHVYWSNHINSISPQMMSPNNHHCLRIPLEIPVGETPLSPSEHVPGACGSGDKSRSSYHIRVGSRSRRKDCNPDGCRPLPGESTEKSNFSNKKN